jgi:D-beta-D-heptose 7-phosphate kinase / D-beta-D-heptose 1-phosphate adenosyltransferase
MTKVAVIGDIIIDKYIYGTSERLSPEAPVPVVKYLREIETLGGAGLVYENLLRLGVDVDMFDVTPNKSVKTRVICDGHYITRIDNDAVADSAEVLRLLKDKDFSIYNYVILSDYNKGVLGRSLEIINHLNSFNCKVIVDPKRHASYYKGAWLVKPNSKEYRELGFDKWLGNIITTDAQDAVHAKIDNADYTAIVDQVEVSDVTGAGDCFLAAFVYGITIGKSYATCLQMAVDAATESVKHVGTYVLSKKDFEETVVFTNGVFDILHKGHFELLKEARSLGTKLVVGINSDASVKRLKGESRPINDERTRVEQLESLPWVDEVFVFNDDTPYNLIKKLNPALIVKGGDYTVETVVGHNLAPVHLVPTVEGYSTTRIIEKSK